MNSPSPAASIFSKIEFILLVLGILLSHAVLPVRSAPAVTLATGSAAGGLALDFTDDTNAPWALQSSPDLVTWTERRAFQVHNTGYRFDIDATAAGARLFFRVVSADSTPVADSRAERTSLPVTPDNYVTLNLPAHLLAGNIRNQDNTSATNPATNTGATLGRVLFYDKRLSANNTVSCASCHQPEHGFSDGRRFSVGFEGELTDRNSMGLTSARYYQSGKFFWDERSATLEEQVLEPIQNAVEMGMTLPALTAKLGDEQYYQQLFTSAFGDAAITSERIAKALAQFIRSIVSKSTKYDAGVATNFANFTAEENQGRQLFGASGCAACHGTDNFVPPVAFNNGLEFPFVDLGLGAVTGQTTDNGKFKSPSLRNIGLTAPHMHDGRFATLRDVVDFYNAGAVNNPNLAAQLRAPGGQKRRLSLADPQKNALVAFLNTLTDTTVTTDPRFADPFRTGEAIVVPQARGE